MKNHPSVLLSFIFINAIFPSKQFERNRNMNLIARLFVFSFLFFAMFNGCKKSDDGTTPPTTTTESVSDDEIANAVAKSLVSGEGGVGLTGIVNISGEKSNGTHLLLKQNNPTSPNIDSTFHKAGNTQYASYDYTLTMNIKFIKRGEEYQIYIPTCDTAKVNIKAYGSVIANSGKYAYYDTTYLGNTYLTGIVASSDTIKLSGTAYYYSNFKVVATDRMYTLATMMTFTSLKVPKSTYMISGGTVTISIEATLKNGKTVSATGTVTFNGNQTATLTFHNKQFVINLNSGLVVS